MLISPFQALLSLSVLCLLGLTTFPVAMATDQVIESKRLSAGKAGQLEIRFTAQVNASEQALFIRQSALNSLRPVTINDKEIGTLQKSDHAMIGVLAIPAGLLRDGENTLHIRPPTKGSGDIEVGPVWISPMPIKQAIGGSTLQVTVSDSDSGSTIPSRITLTRRDGALQPLQAEPAGKVAVRVGVVYMQSGTATISVPPGDYDVQAGHGFEWSVDKKSVSLKADDVTALSLKLRREVDTKGWVAVDSHIHTRPFTNHGDAQPDERMFTIAGEGIEVAIATDHNHITDFIPLAERAQVAQHFTPVIGSELTTKRGHFTIFPIFPGSKLADHNEADWSHLIPAMRATPGLKVIVLNHPRWNQGSLTPFGKDLFDPVTGEHKHADDFHVDGIEVINSGTLQADFRQSYRDWFAMLNRGQLIAGIGSSDSHSVGEILGQGRTYAQVQDDNPAKIDIGAVCESYKKGRLRVSMGLLASLTVNKQFGIGDLATELGESMHVEAVISGPSWVKADKIELFANGIRIREQAISDNYAPGEKARIAWDIPRPKHDVHLVVIASGPGITEPFWAIPPTGMPTSVIGSTNPIWVDGDNDGRFQPAFAIAQGLINRLGANREVIQNALKEYDHSVVIQAESLLSDK